MKITDIKEVADLYYAINLNDLHVTNRSIYPIKSPNESPWGTYLRCHIYPNYGNYSISMYLFDGEKEITSYERNGWKFSFQNYMHINWNFRICRYLIIDNTGESLKGIDNPDLGGRFNLKDVSLEMDDLIRLGWSIFADISDKYYSFEHKYLFSNLQANYFSVKKNEVSCSKMGEMVSQRQHFRKRIMDFINTIPEEKRVVFEESIATMQNFPNSYCDQIWKTSISNTSHIYSKN